MGTLGATTTIGASGTYVALGGYHSPGDGGGGILLPQPTTVAACAPDGGLVFTDGNGICFARADPTDSVREWGAYCDVTGVTDASWTVSGASGTLTIPDTPLNPPVAGENIVISQIGVPTLWGTSTPAVSMTRFSTLSNTGTHYMPGDLISFAGGTFSQQAAIIVDAVDASGAITQWHFLWGGLYQRGGALPGSPMAQDDARSHCGTLAGCGTLTGQAGGAMMAPAWSGWSLLNVQKIQNPGSHYSVGDMVTFVQIPT